MMKPCHYACGTAEHVIRRREFFGTLSRAGAGIALSSLGLFTRPAIAAALGRSQKRMLVINMAGGLSQLESWDPKPGTATGGPFRAIATSAPGIQISELLPHTAKIMHHLSLVRSVNTHEDDHGKGEYIMSTGRRKTPAQDYPQLGAVVAKALDSENGALPGNIVITPGGGGGRNADSAYLGPRYSSVVLGNGAPPQFSQRPESLSENASICANDLRHKINDRFALRRRTAQTEAYTQSFEQGLELMRQREIFDLTKEPAKDHERYGTEDFGRHCLLARRLIEKGLTYVRVTHANYDTHNENFNFHFEQLGDFDRPFATLIGDLHDRGLLEHTLVVVLSEFGRTPKINPTYGRDHFSKAWSICVGGTGIKPGAVIGATNKDGNEVTDRQVDAGELFHTYLTALGLQSHDHFKVAGQKMPMADPAFDPIQELLA
ncbi:MAG: DUF1501 domain-containing protein [Chthoniobacterales bacterium]